MVSISGLGIMRTVFSGLTGSGFGGLWPGAHQVQVSVSQSPSKLLLRLSSQPQPHGWPKMLKSTISIAPRGSFHTAVRSSLPERTELQTEHRHLLQLLV